MDALVLAAGLGSRLGELTRERPKALLPVGQRSLLDHVLDRIDRLDRVDRAVVVTGYGRGQVREHLEKRPEGRPRVVEAYNPDYEEGNFLSLLRGLEEVGPSWVVMNVDHIYPLPLLERCVERAREVSAACDRDRELKPDCMKVRSSGDARRVVEIDKGLETWGWGYIGMTFVTEGGREAYLDAVDALRSTSRRDLRAESVLQALADRGRPARILDASGFGWLEVDDPDDRARAERRLRGAFDETEPLMHDPNVREAQATPSRT